MLCFENKSEAAIKYLVYSRFVKQSFLSFFFMLFDLDKNNLLFVLFLVFIFALIFMWLVWLSIIYHQNLNNLSDRAKDSYIMLVILAIGLFVLYCSVFSILNSYVIYDIAIDHI